MTLLHSTTFRHAMFYAVLFTASVTVLFAFFYWSTAAYMQQQTDDTIEAEITGLAENYSRRGIRGLRQQLTERINRNSPTTSSIYLLTDGLDRRIVGNLNRWPENMPTTNGWVNFQLRDTSDEHDNTYRARGRAFRLSDGYKLLVGRDIRERTEVKKRVIWAIGWGSAITLLLGLAGGVIMSRGVSRRIDAINNTSREIMSGDLSRRIPTRNTNDEYDQLAGSLNRMLNQIESLLEGVKRVSDNIAHDLKTPLARLRNQLETAKNMRPSDEQADALNNAVTEADGLLSTFNALLRIARIEAAEQRAGFADVDLSTLNHDVLELYEPLAAERNITLVSHIEDNVELKGDRDLIFQAVANLLDNAIKYSPADFEVVLRLESTQNNILLSVSDQGPGIPANDTENVLQRFFRLDQSRTTSGNGLGLSLVAAVAKLHGMKIEMRNNAPGLIFTLHIPNNRPE
ncbi:MAG: sensor histidine kinase [Arenicellales bacterium WSBS_2016_MAG_OTU3]